MVGVVLLVILGADPDAALSKGDQPRRYHEINRDIRDWLRREAVADDDSQRAEAIFRLTQLYRELKQDPRLADSDTLTAYKNRLWGRLTRVKRDLEREFARDEQGQAQVLQQQRVADGATAGLADSLLLASYASGGPASLLSQVGQASRPATRGGGAIPDYGPGLVSLIERTIAPEFWDVHGGPGTIVYYAPLRVLVVRATSEIHDNVGGVVGGLRAAK